MTRAKADIQRELEQEEARLAELDQQRERTRARVHTLRSELEARPPPLPPSSPEKVHLASAEKVRMFRSLFQGRTDVYPVRFVSKKTGKPGYSPECANRWTPGCALKTGGKCSDCSIQRFPPVSDQVVLDHLKGKHVLGVYPLLIDETCWFLAADFDKSSWRDDVAAFVETCRILNVPVAIERSRSGNGAHAWIFFEAPVPATTARRMGCFLITETMERRHELSMDSYDRLFPNQDTMPRGGYGNLIALPLQREPRQQGNSVFVDESFLPHPDQWAFLSSVVRMRLEAVELIAREAARTGQVLGVRHVETMDEEEVAAPWIRPPSGRSPTKPISGPLPPVVSGVLAQRLFIEKAGLPPVLLNRLKRLAAFQNPEFYKKQAMRLSTALIPRVIACAEDLPLFISLPRGCVEPVRKMLSEHSVELELRDDRASGEELSFKFRGELTPVQHDAAQALLANDTGVFVGPPGIGKTVLGTYLVAERSLSTLILVHRKPLLEQWVAQLAMFLGIDEKEVGQIGGGKKKPNGRLDVAMIQSLVKKDKVEDLVAGYGHVIVDECHHLPALSFERVLSEVRARYVVGLTATPQRRDGHQPITEQQLGPVRFRVDGKAQAARRPFEHKLIVRETGFRMEAGSAEEIQEVYRALVHDGARNTRIIDDVLAVLHEGRSPILLTEWKDHLDYFAERLRPAVRHLVVLHGGMGAKARREALAKLSLVTDLEERLILATGRYIGEGFDDARLDTLFLTMPISWKGNIVQYSGRLHRRHPTKTEVRIYDYVDREVPKLLTMFEKRLRTYRAIGYARGEAPLGFAEPFEEPTIDYEQDLVHYDEESR